MRDPFLQHVAAVFNLGGTQISAAISVKSSGETHQKEHRVGSGLGGAAQDWAFHRSIGSERYRSGEFLRQFLFFLGVFFFFFKRKFVSFRHIW